MGKDRQIRKKRRKGALYCLLLFSAAAFVAAAGVYLLRHSGRKQLREGTVGDASAMHAQMERRRHTSELDVGLDYVEKAFAEAEDGIVQTEDVPEEKEGRIIYGGKTYDFNEDIMTFLVMGIDQRSETVREWAGEKDFDGGSADAVFLIVLNPHNSRMQIIAIDRNTITDVDFYDEEGKYTETLRTQLAVQHGFGDGAQKSAEYMEKAVSNLFYGLPIHGYCAVNMSAIEKVNDAVGGIDVTVLEDLTQWDGTLVKGQTVHLEGKSAFYYLRCRDTKAFGSAERRLERQKQYIGAFIMKAKQQFKENPALPITLFQQLKPYMTTDLTMGKAAYLAGLAAGFDFGATDIRKVEGETVMGEKFEEFYVDEEALYRMILDTFYEEAD